MRLRTLFSTTQAFALAVTASAVVQPPGPPTFGIVQNWAGADADAMGFTREQVEIFLAARKADLSAARQPQWSTWLKGLEQGKNPSLRAWALARRVEAGDYTAYPAFEDAITEHLLGISKPGSGRDDRIITDPPCIMGVPMPDALSIDHTSVFWRSLRKTLQSTQDRKLNTGLVVDPQGKPISARPVPGPWLGFFAPTGVAYGMRWRFRAAELNGVPMYARFRLTMPFRLRN